MPIVTQGGGGHTWMPSMIGFVDGQILIESETDSSNSFTTHIHVRDHFCKPEILHPLVISGAGGLGW